MEEPDTETWTAWFLDAIRKIRSQKQRPSVERIAHAIRLQHDFHEEVIAENLQHAVKRGDVLKLFNKGQSSYKVTVIIDNTSCLLLVSSRVSLYHLDLHN
jgi:histone acetyltransferase MYST4